MTPWAERRLARSSLARALAGDPRWVEPGPISGYGDPALIARRLDAPYEEPPLVAPVGEDLRTGTCAPHPGERHA